MKNSDSERVLNNTISAIKADVPSEQDIAAVAVKVNAKLFSRQSDRGVVDVASADEEKKPLNSIEHYIAAIPDYLAGNLPSAQKLLFEEESRHSLLLRRKLKSALEKKKNEINEPRESLESIIKKERPNYLSWFGSAAAALVLAVSAVWMYSIVPSFDQSQIFQVENVKGKLYEVVNGGLQELSPGDWIDGQMDVRTGNRSTAILRLDDDSLVELNNRTEVSVTRRRAGNQINIDRGQIIVAASKQGSGHLDVATKEFVVSVKGTVFQVAHGSMGSNVSVIEGEVQVDQDGINTSLLPGNQLGSRTGLSEKNFFGVFADEFSWSENGDEYLAILGEMQQLQHDIDMAMASDSRFDTRLLQLMPEDTVIYMAVPNAPQKISEVYNTIRDRIEKSERLTGYWEQLLQDSQGVDQTMRWLTELGAHLGEETVVGLVLNEHGTRVVDGVEVPIVSLDPIILSEVDDNFGQTFEPLLQEFQDKLSESNLAASTEINNIQFNFIESAALAIEDEPNFLLKDDLLIVSGRSQSLVAMEQAIDAGNSRFVNGDFYQMLFNQYSEGAQFLGAADLKTIMDRTVQFDDEGEESARFFGVDDAQYVVANRKQDEGGTAITTTVDLQFGSERHGLMSILAAPGPMGALEFFSDSTTIANAMLFERPLTLLDEFERLTNDYVTSEAERVQNFRILEALRHNVLPSFGGEIAIGLDGPALPTPAWKIVLEVYDQNLFQTNIETVVERINSYIPDVENAVSGKFELIFDPASSYSGYRLEFPKLPEGGVESALMPSSINYAYVDGYMIISPNLPMLRRTITQYQSGVSLLSDEHFQSLLPDNGSLNVSALTFSRLQEMMFGLAKSVGWQMTDEQREIFGQHQPRGGASIYSATGNKDSISIYNRGGSFVGANLSSVLALYSAFGAVDVAEQGTTDSMLAPASGTASADEAVPTVQ